MQAAVRMGRPKPRTGVRRQVSVTASRSVAAACSRTARCDPSSRRDPADAEPISSTTRTPPAPQRRPNFSSRAGGTSQVAKEAAAISRQPSRFQQSATATYAGGFVCVRPGVEGARRTVSWRQRVGFRVGPLVARARARDERLVGFAQEFAQHSWLEQSARHRVAPARAAIASERRKARAALTASTQRAKTRKPRNTIPSVSSAAAGKPAQPSQRGRTP